MQQKLARLVLLGGIAFGAWAAHLGAVGAAPDQAKAADPWLPVRSLLGSWEGDAKGEPGTGRCEREYRLTLKDKFITSPARTSRPIGDALSQEAVIVGRACTVVDLRLTRAAVRHIIK
jgi:hypothetical protein